MFSEQRSASVSTTNKGAERYYEMPVILWRIAGRLMSEDNSLHSEPVRIAASLPVQTVLQFTSVYVSARLVFLLVHD